MASDRTFPILGWRVLALGFAVLGLTALALHDFLPGQPAPKDLPGRPLLAHAVAGVLIVAGSALAWRRTVVAAAMALLAYYGLVVVLLMDGRVMLRHWREYLAYENLAEQLALTAALLVVLAGHAGLEPARAARLIRLGRWAFGACAVVFGGAHFAYMNLTAPLVPKWLPPGQDFWAYATGLCHIAAGLALLTGVQARLAAILLTVMYAAFTPLVHLPMLFADPADHGAWAENATNLALTGAAWVMADSLRRRAGPA